MILGPYTDSSNQTESTGIPTLKTADGSLILLGLNVKKSTRPDEIAAWILKETASQSSTFLTYLFNQSLSTGELPDDWRLANIFTLHKKIQKKMLKITSQSHSPVFARK